MKTKPCPNPRSTFKPKPPALPPEHRCNKCDEHDRQINSLLSRLDVQRNAQGELVMWPGADMRWHAIDVAVAGLLQREIENSQIETVLLEAGIRSEGDLVEAVKRLVKLKYQ